MARRDFFQALGRESAGTTAAALGAMTKAQAELAAEAASLAAAAGISFEGPIVTLDGGPEAGSRERPSGPAASSPAALPYRSPYRAEPSAVIVVDQRRLPAALVEVPCLQAADAAAAIRDGLAQGPGTIAAVGAYGLARGAAARGAVYRPATADPVADASDLDSIHFDANAILAAAPWVVPLRAALDRLVARAATAEPRTAPLALAEMLQAEADAIVMEQLAASSALVAHGVELLRAAAAGRDPAAGPLRVLVHGPVGALAFGQVGTVTAVLGAAAGAGLPVYAWVAEGRPPLSGVRTAWELSLAGVAHGLVPDSAVGGLLAGSVELVLTGALGVTAAGDVVDEPGAYAIAALAARHGLPVYASIVRSMLFSAQMQPTARFDVTPAELISGFLTESGLVRPPFGPALATLAAPTPGAAR